MIGPFLWIGSASIYLALNVPNPPSVCEIFTELILTLRDFNDLFTLCSMSIPTGAIIAVIIAAVCRSIWPLLNGTSQTC